MARKAKKDGMAVELVGETEVRRQFFAGDLIPDNWQVSSGDFEQVGASRVYGETPFENPARDNLANDDPDSGTGPVMKAREAAAKARAK